VPFRWTGRFISRWLDVIEVLAWIAFFVLALGFSRCATGCCRTSRSTARTSSPRSRRAPALNITVGAIEPDWRGFLPRLVVADVRVYDPAGNEAIVLPIVDAVVSWRTLLHAELRLHSLAIDGPRPIAAPRSGRHDLGRRHPPRRRGKGDSRLADWILEQREIEVRNAEIGWLDEKRGAPPLALTQLNFRLRNEDYEHQFGLSARPPASLGSALEVRAELAGASVRQIQSWSGRVFAELGTTDLAGWRAWFDYPVDLRNGNGAVRMWSTLIGGEVRRATRTLRSPVSSASSRKTCRC
jgi:uncharacterized protein YhdP